MKYTYIVTTLPLLLRNTLTIIPENLRRLSTLPEVITIDF